MSLRPLNPTEKRALARIEKLTAAHEAFDPQNPSKAWRQSMSDGEVGEHLSAMLDAYELVAPHLTRRDLLIALRNLMRAHPKLRLRGTQADQPANYITHDGAPFYWGGVRVGKGNKIIPGGVGRFPLDLYRYSLTEEGQTRAEEGKPLFHPIDSVEGKKVARKPREPVARDSKEGKALLRRRGKTG